MDENPYQSPEPGQVASHFMGSDRDTTKGRVGCLSVDLVVLIAALLAAPLVAAFVALIYRFPIPFSGYESGPRAFTRAFFAGLLYEAFGGFLVVGLCGIVAGIIASRIAKEIEADWKSSLLLAFAFALAADVPPVLLLAMLDKIVGPW